MSVDAALRKILENSETDLNHYLSAFSTDLLLTQAIAYDGSNQTEYIGYTLPGTGKGEAKWLIKKLTYSSGLVTDIQFANSKATFESVWNDRTGLSYG